MFDKFHLFYRNKLWHHQELVWMMRIHSAIPVASSSRKTAWKQTIFTRKPILHTSQSSLVIRSNHGHRITLVIHVRSILDSGITERENPSPLIYPWFGELLLITTMIAISVQSKMYMVSIRRTVNLYSIHLFHLQYEQQLMTSIFQFLS